MIILIFKYLFLSWISSSSTPYHLSLPQIIFSVLYIVHLAFLDLICFVNYFHFLFANFVFFSDISWEDNDSPNRLVRYEDYSWSLFSKNFPAISFKIPDFIFSFFKLSLLRELVWIMGEVVMVRIVFINFYIAMSVPFLLRRSQPYL